MKKASFVLVMLLIVSMVLTGCAPTGGTQTIKVGVIGELTGDIPAVGASCKNAAEMAVKEINDAGGLEVGGKKYQIDLFIEDNAGKADQSASAAQKLITQQNVVAIIGPNASRYAIPASEIAESSQGRPDQPLVHQPQDHAGRQDQRAKEVRLPCLLHRPVPGPRGGQVRPG